MISKLFPVLGLKPWSTDTISWYLYDEDGKEYEIFSVKYFPFVGSCINDSFCMQVYAESI